MTWAPRAGGVRIMGCDRVSCPSCRMSDRQEPGSRLVWVPSVTGSARWCRGVSLPTLGCCTPWRVATGSQRRGRGCAPRLGDAATTIRAPSRYRQSRSPGSSGNHLPGRPRPMAIKRIPFFVAVLIAIAAMLAGCGSSPTVATQPRRDATTARCGGATKAFSLSLVSSTGGQPSPEAAATYFALHGASAVSFAVPHGGWIEIRRSPGGATVRSNDVTLHTIQGPDHTWQVDGGRQCS